MTRTSGTRPACAPEAYTTKSAFANIFRCDLEKGTGAISMRPDYTRSADGRGGYGLSAVASAKAEDPPRFITRPGLPSSRRAGTTAWQARPAAGHGTSRSRARVPHEPCGAPSPLGVAPRVRFMLTGFGREGRVGLVATLAGRAPGSAGTPGPVGCRGSTAGDSTRLADPRVVSAM